MKSTLTSSKAPARAWFSLLALVGLILLAACGSNTSTGSTAAPNATSNTSANSTPTSGGGRYGSGYGNGYGTGGTTPTVSSSGSLIRTATATVNGKSETILTNTQGMTLYYRTTDMPPTTVCSGGCASVWPPLLVSGSNTATSTTSLPGKLSVQADANGSQVEYNGHPLYTFSGDTAPGQTTGEGFGGIWHVCTPSLT
jgi:predicted lipoprotein with Yx(FWY)xxD motif